MVIIFAPVESKVRGLEELKAQHSENKDHGGISSKEYDEKNANAPKGRKTAKVEVFEKQLVHNAKHSLTSTAPPGVSYTRAAWLLGALITASHEILA